MLAVLYSFRLFMVDKYYSAISEAFRAFLSTTDFKNSSLTRIALLEYDVIGD